MSQEPRTHTMSHVNRFPTVLERQFPRFRREGCAKSARQFSMIQQRRLPADLWTLGICHELFGGSG